MRVRFWGTRGSLAKPGPSTVRYGGNTSCVEVTSPGGTRLIIDCGTGGHELAQAIMREGRPSRGHMLISHTHWDHIQGIPFFTPFFVPGHEWDLYAPQGFDASLKEALAGQMEYTYFPVTLDAFGGKVSYHDLGEGSLVIDDVTIHTRYLNHPALTLAFRIEAGGVAIVYACDHEPHSRDLAMGDSHGDGHAHAQMVGEDLAHAEFMRGADLIIHDAQYTAPEYDAKRGWGHSTVEYALAVGRAAGAARLALTHHDPLRNDDAVDVVLKALRAQTSAGDPDVFAAAEGMVIDLEPSGAADRIAQPTTNASALRDGAIVGIPSMLLIAADTGVIDRITRAVADEPIQLYHAATAAEAIGLLGHEPALLMVEQDVPGLDDVVGELAGREVALVLIGGSGAPDGVAVDRLAEPWSVEYARTRIRTWLLRTEALWARPPIPADEDERIEALHALDILDTPQEDRFDRHTRLAAALFRVPVALISLVDTDRQWFKSCFGTDLSETSREVSFCAHAVAAREMLVVQDTLLDPRFKEHPLVQSDPHIRFYAGALLHGKGGQPIGTLCVIDTRARAMSDAERSLLADLASVVETELSRASGTAETAP